MPKIVVVGSSNTDMMVKIPHIPTPGETVLGGEFLMAAGGGKEPTRPLPGWEPILHCPRRARSRRFWWNGEGSVGV